MARFVSGDVVVVPLPFTVLSGACAAALGIAALKKNGHELKPCKNIIDIFAPREETLGIMEAFLFGGTSGAVCCTIQQDSCVAKTAKFKPAQFLLLVLLLGCLRLNAGAFTNGSFEVLSNVTIAPGTTASLNPGDTWLVGWTVGGPGGDVVVANGNIDGFNPYDGQQFIVFNGGNTPPGGWLSQSFSTTIGWTNRLTLAVGQTGVGDVSLTVAATALDGSVLASNLCLPSSGVWTSFELDFAATTTNTILVLTDTSADTGDVDLLLDDIAVFSYPTAGPPVIAQSPSNQVAALGSPVTFNPWIAGGPSTAQWYQGTNLLAGATNSTLTIVATDASAGVYTVVFSNSFGVAISQPAALTVIDPPVIVSSPSNQTANIGDEVTFSASAGGGPAVIQWYQGTYAIPRATNTTLTLTASGAAMGRYTAIFSNLAGTVTSAPALLTVIGASFVNGGFEILSNTNIQPGTAALLNPWDTWLVGWAVRGPGGDVAVANGNVDGFTPYDGQQFIVFNGGNTPPGGSLSQSFSTTVGSKYGVTFAIGQADVGYMGLTVVVTALDGSVLASNRCTPSAGTWTPFGLVFTATTGDATLTLTDTSASTFNVDLLLDDVAVFIATPPVIVASPSNQTANVGDEVTFSASASGSPAAVQWYQGTNAIAGATKTTLTVIANGAAIGSYWAKFSNMVGTATTASALLTVIGVPFVNGGFEILSNATITPGNAPWLNPGATWLVGWTVGGLVEEIGVGNGNIDGLAPYDGQQFILFEGLGRPPNGSLSQSFSTAIGSINRVIFAVGRTSFGTPSLAVTATALDGTVLASNRYVPPPGGWTLFELDFTASTADTTLTLTDMSGDCDRADLLLDGVVVLSYPTAGPPVIVVSPSSQTATTGSPVTFNPWVTGGPSTAQWYQGTNLLAGATNSTLTIVASDASAGVYTVVFSNSFGVAISQPTALTVIDPPVLVSSPSSQTANVGNEVTFSASAGGSPAAVQWYHGTYAISGATNTTLTLIAGGAAIGNYSACFSNLAGSVTSAPALLAVAGAPFVNGGFETLNNRIIPAGSVAFLNPGATWLLGWTAGGPGYDVLVGNGNVDGFNPYDGQQFILFNAGDTPPGGWLSQSFSTPVGSTNRVAFAVGQAGVGNVSLTATATALDGSVLASNFCVPTPGIWTPFELVFTATTIDTTLTLIDSSSSTWGTDLLLDTVSLNGPFEITQVPNQFATVNQPLLITNQSYSATAPVTFTLGTGAPMGASISTNGVFTWVPQCDQGSTSNVITVWATDSSSPPMSNSMTFSVTVSECVQLSLGSAVTQVGQDVCVPVNLESTVALTNLNIMLDYPAGCFANWQFSPSNVAIASVVVQNVDSSDSLLNIRIQAGQSLLGTALLGWMCCATLPGTSGFLSLAVASISGADQNGGPITQWFAAPGRVVAIGSQPLLESSLAPNSTPMLTLYGNPGTNYQILSNTNLAAAASWAPITNVTLTGLSQSIGLGAPTNQMEFFRAVAPAH